MDTQMKKKSIITLCFVVVCAILLNYVAFIGFNIAGFSYGGMFGETGIKKGIDLAGGSVITFQADSDAPTDDQMQVVESIFQTRMTNAGYTEARISQGEGGKITVESVFAEGSEFSFSLQYKKAEKGTSNLTKLKNKTHTTLRKNIKC